MEFNHTTQILMSKFSAARRAECLGVVDALMQLPCSQFFIDSTSTGSDISVRYYEVVKNPIDLNMIKDKLSANKYTSISKWEHDMHLIWQNADKYSGNNSPITYLAHQYKKRLEKLLVSLHDHRLGKWVQHLFKINAKMEGLINNGPSLFKAFRSIDFESSIQFNDADLNIFVRVSKYFTEKHDMDEIRRLILQYQPDILKTETKNVIDVSDLTPTTLSVIKDFFVRRLADMNLVYPKS